jgi:hypothetical protein
MSLKMCCLYQRAMVRESREEEEDECMVLSRRRRRRLRSRWRKDANLCFVRP